MMPDDIDALFWKNKSLKELSESEWEQLCDGCGKCCLHKLEDEDTGIIYYTNIICRQLDESTCQCRDYERRTILVKDCVLLDATSEDVLMTMPTSCAYRLIYEGKELPAWHHLISANKKLVHKLNKSIKGRVVNEADVLDYENHIVDWPIQD